MQEKHSKVVIADGHEIVRDGIASVLEAKCNVTVVGQAADGYGTLKQCRSLKPDILLMDFGLINPSGMAVFEKLRATQPDIRIAVISSDMSTVDAYVLLANGATGFVQKQASSSHFVNAIRTISMGYACVEATVLQEFVGLRQNISRTGNVYGLSRREMEILEHSRSGSNTKEIAKKLQISTRTVETHRNAIYRKTSTNSVAGLQMVAQNIASLSNPS